MVQEKYRKAKGYLNWDSGFLDTGIQMVSLTYYAFRPDQLQAYEDFLENGTHGQTPVPGWGSGYEYAYLFAVFTID